MGTAREAGKLVRMADGAPLEQPDQSGLGLVELRDGDKRPPRADKGALAKEARRRLGHVAIGLARQHEEGERHDLPGIHTALARLEKGRAQGRDAAVAGALGLAREALEVGGRTDEEARGEAADSEVLDEATHRANRGAAALPCIT